MSCLITLFLYIYPQGNQQGNKSFNLSWLRVRMSYHIFNNLAELLNGDLAAKIGRDIFSKYLIDRECSCSVPYKANRKYFYEGKFRSKCLIYEVKCSIWEAIYIGNTQHTFKKNNGRSFLRSPTSTQQRKKLLLICWPLRTAL